jgi:cyclophilin family peptidyl-prolyl cis-trans isomerase
MEGLIYNGATEWNDLTPDLFTEWVTGKAEELGLDMAKFNQDYTSQAVTQRIDEDIAEGRQAGVGGTPTIYINGSLYEGQRSLEIFTAILQLFQLKDRQYSDCPPMAIDPAKSYTATLKTDKGDIVIELYADKAPIAVNSFIFLAREGWFDNVIFHRVIPGFVAQTGDPLGMGFGGPGYAFSNEISADLKFDGPGVVGMANSGPDVNGSQFFITYDAVPDLDGGYTIFGKVIAGMDVVKNLTARDPSQGGELPPGDKILSVVIEEK